MLFRHRRRCCAISGSASVYRNWSASIAVDEIFEFLAGLEIRNSFGRHFHLFTRLGIAPDPRVALPDSKAAEAADFQLVADSQRLDDTLEQGVHDDFRILPRQLRNF